MNQEERQFLKVTLAVLILFLVSLLIGVGLGIILDRRFGDKTEPIEIIVHDTLFVESPIPVDEKPIGEICGKFPIVPKNSRKEERVPLNPKIETDTPKPINDSVEVLIPITQKEYADSDYHAWVSGYNPSLDSIKLYRTTITRTKVETPKWGLSVGVGAAVGPRVEPCVFVGLTYTILPFKTTKR